jgi:hypothetical protein
LFCFFCLDFVHPDDVEKVREQLNLQPQDGSPNGSGNGRVLDLRTGTVKKDGHATGARLGKFLDSYRLSLIEILNLTREPHQLILSV